MCELFSLTSGNRSELSIKLLPCKPHLYLHESCLRSPRTQYLINQGILNVWKTAHADGDQPRNVTRHDGTGMTGIVLDAPKIIIFPKEGNRTLVIYQINIISGSLKLFTSNDGNDMSTIVSVPDHS